MLTVPVYDIQSASVGQIQITIKDPNYPMWKGKYQTGKLALYFADVIDGKPLLPIIPVIYVVSDQDLPELNCLGYQVYGAECSLFAIRANLMHIIDKHYKDYLLEYKKQNEPVLH